MQCCRSGFYAIRLADHAGTHWRNVTIRNNSFDKEINPDGGVPYTNVKILGNIGPRVSFFTGATGGEGSKPGGISVDYNVWYSGRKVGANDQVAPSGYTNAAAGDLHLKAGAAAIDAGHPSDHPAADIDGDSRPSGSAPDAGADEWTVGGPPRPTRYPQAAERRGRRPGRQSLGERAEWACSLRSPTRRSAVRTRGATTAAPSGCAPTRGRARASS